jgi:hypothetical protein
LKRISKSLWIVLLISLMTLLTGCFYPKDQLQQNQANPEEFITVVQGAVDKFRELKGGLLPIKNSTLDTHIYEKYKVDFKKLQSYRLLSTIPGNAFENGGNYIYVIVDAETEPKIKLIDVASYQAVNQIQDKVHTYISETNGKLPKSEQVSDEIYLVDFELLKIDKPIIYSPYNRNNELNYLIHESGMVTIDYSFDLMKLIDSKSLHNELAAEEDLRDLLIKHTPFMPIKSVPYHWSEGHPIPKF